MDIATIQGMVSAVGFPIVMVGACGWFIWSMYKTQIADKERLYSELGKSINANEKFAEIISTYTNKLDAIQEDVKEIKELVRE